MKKAITIFLIVSLCILLFIAVFAALAFHAYNKQNAPDVSGFTGNDNTSIDAPGNIEQDTPSQPVQTEHMEPIYDSAKRALCLYDFSTGKKITGFSFDTAQRVLLLKKTADGVILLSSEESAGKTNVEEEGSGDGIVFSGGGYNAGAISAFCLWKFDDKLNLLNKTEITDETIVERIKDGIPALLPDGETLVILSANSIFQVDLTGGKHSETPVSLPTAVTYILADLSEDGTTFFYAGDADTGMVYGASRLADGNGTLFQAEDFQVSSIAVSGNFAVIRAATPPHGAGTSGCVLLVSPADGQEIKLKSAEENGHTSVTEDGKTIVSCADAGGTGGILRCYDVQSGALAAEQPFDMGTACRVYQAFTQGGFGYAVVSTDDGYRLSQPIPLP